MIEYRTAKGGVSASGRGLNGLVTPYNVWTTIGDPKRGGFRERIAPGTFTKTLQERDIVALWNHNADMPFARTSVAAGEVGHLALRADGAEGLEADVPEPVPTSYAKDLHLLTSAGVVRGMSFGFEVLKDSWTDDEGRASNSAVGTQRTIHEVRLHEVSAVTFPAYESTKFSARDAISAARGTADTRAAKATYADVDTCECGSTNEYGAYCSACGEPMKQAKPSDGFCTSCGAAMDGERSHVCATEKRTVSAEIDAALDSAFDAIRGVDRNNLPAEVNQFIDLASGALKLASADLQETGTPDPDNPNGNEYESEAASSTSDVDDNERSALIDEALIRMNDLSALMDI